MIIKIMLENSEDLRWVAILLGPSPRRPRKAAAVTGTRGPDGSDGR
jgi:hypothetical protein